MTSLTLSGLSALPNGVRTDFFAFGAVIVGQAPTISSLDISGNNLSSEETKAQLDAINDSPSIKMFETVNINSANFDDDDSCLKLADLINTDLKLTNLDITE